MHKIFPTLFQTCYSINIENKVENKKGLNARRRRIITEMRDDPNITTSELHQILGISEMEVENNLTFLKENGYVERVGLKRSVIGKYLSDMRINKCKGVSSMQFCTTII